MALHLNTTIPRASWKLPLDSGVNMPDIYFATQYRLEIPFINSAYTSLNGEYVEVVPSFANQCLGAGWYPPFDDEIGLYSGIGTDEEQERDNHHDDLYLFVADKIGGVHRRIHMDSLDDILARWKGETYLLGEDEE